jgi:predicted nucleotidyltransferase component of viral defense system
VIPTAAISAWAEARPWPDRLAVEQDLVIARSIVAIYEHPLLSSALVLKGGASLHQVYLASPRRYTEDLDFNCATDIDPPEVLGALWEAARSVGLSGPPARYQLNRGSAGARFLTESPKITLRARSEDPARQLRVKVEINTRERSFARSLARVPFLVNSAWFSGCTDVLTYTTAELIADKMRALYERSKGRDLFDIWLALTELAIDPAEIITCFDARRPDGYTTAQGIASLQANRADPAFRADLTRYVAAWPDDYDVDCAAELVTDLVLRWL